MSCDNPVNLVENGLTRLGQSLSVPHYDRLSIDPGIVHLGVGGFHRAHQAMYTDTLLQMGIGRWGICGAGIIDGDREMAQALSSQDYLYTLVEQSPTERSVRVIGSIVDYILAANDPEPLIQRIAAEPTRIVSLTVTEDGYHYDNDSHRLDTSDEAVAHDIEHPEVPRTVAGILVAALDRRRRAGRNPITVLSCDNVPENGTVTRTVVCELAGHIDPVTRDWIEAEIPFPLTMVDRITPQTTPEQHDWLRRTHCVDDRWPVFCEDFVQWVIEDNFAAGRPNWDRAGAQFVSDVRPYELMKIRLLNGSHSVLSYPGLLLGYQDVDEAMSDQDVLTYIKAYMEDVTPTVPPVPGIDLGEYKSTLLTRFANPAVRDQLSRLARFGSRKIPNAILAPAREAMYRGDSVRLMGFSVATWIHFYAEVVRGEQPRVPDPLGNRLYEAAPACRPDPGPFLGVREVFPKELAARGPFYEAVRNGLSEIRELGLRQAMQRVSAGI